MFVYVIIIDCIGGTMENNKKDDMINSYKSEDDQFLELLQSCNLDLTSSESLTKYMKYFKESRDGREYENKFRVIFKEGEEWIYNSALSTVWDFDSEESLHKYLEEIYIKDKKKYLRTGVWPNTKFFFRDGSWTYYYYMQLNDPEVKLKNYLDFDYCSSNWSRERLIELTEKYGKNILFPFCVYSSTNPNMSFEDWYNDYMKMRDLNIITPSDNNLSDNLKK